MRTKGLIRGIVVANAGKEWAADKMYCVETRSINKRPTFPSHENKVFELHFLVYKKSLKCNERRILLQESFGCNEIFILQYSIGWLHRLMLRFIRYGNQFRLSIEPLLTGKRKMKGNVVMNLYPWLLLAIFHHYC